MSHLIQNCVVHSCLSTDKVVIFMHAKRRVLTVVAWSVCLYLLVKRVGYMLKRLNRSGSHLGVWTSRPKEPCTCGGTHPLAGRSTFCGVILGHARTCLRSIFSTLFARRLQRCGLCLPVYCINLFKIMIFDQLFIRSQTQLSPQMYHCPFVVLV